MSRIACCQYVLEAHRAPRDGSLGEYQLAPAAIRRPRARLSPLLQTPIWSLNLYEKKKKESNRFKFEQYFAMQRMRIQHTPLERGSPHFEGWVVHGRTAGHLSATPVPLRTGRSSRSPSSRPSSSTLCTRANSATQPSDVGHRLTRSSLAFTPSLSPHASKSGLSLIPPPPLP